MTEFTEDEKRTLSVLVDMIVPASATFGVPSAADPAIFADILSDAARHRERLGTALAALDGLARSGHGVGFADLSADQRNGVVETFRDCHADDANLVATLTTQCYYRDDRVMLSIGMEPRPPHPKGYEVEQGDWSLLDPVRKLDDIYRKTSQP